jgi:hypothetical protein
LKYPTFSSAALAVLLVGSFIAGAQCADGVLLSPADYDYLLTLGVQRDSPVLQEIGPKELHRLHQMISDEKIQNDPKAKSDAVRRALAEFEGNQLWERDNPGKLWDVDRDRDPRSSRRN